LSGQFRQRQAAASATLRSQQDRLLCNGGTAVPDASEVGVVWLEHVVDPFDPVGCHRGTGVVLVNDTILTAGHVADYARAKIVCAQQNLVPKWLRVTLPDPSATGGKQVRVISCGGNLKDGCGARFPASYTTPLSKEVSDDDFSKAQDAALVQVLNGFIVNGLSFFYRRPLTTKSTTSFVGTKVTCYGMSDSAPIAPFTIGELRKADFEVIGFPHPLHPTPRPPKSFKLFTISRGGGMTPTSTAFDPDGGYAAIPVGGDSGGPCIAHTSGVAGDLIGIDHSGEPFASPDSPQYANYIATTSSNSALRDFVRAGLGIQAGRVHADLDLDGAADDGVEVRASNMNPPTIEVVVFYDNGATELAFDTGVLVSAAPFAGSYLGDFDGDGDGDIIGSIGSAASALPVYFNGGLSWAFQFVTPATWQPNGPYQYMSVGRFNGDDVDDVMAVRFDGSEDVFLGEKVVGLTVPAQFVPRGFELFGASSPSYPVQEAFAIAAPGLFFDDPTFIGSIQPVVGYVHLVYAIDDTSGLNVFPMSLDSLKADAPQLLSYSSSPGDRFGRALAWGNFDGDPSGFQALVISAPGVTVAGHTNAGIITYFKADASYTGTKEPIFVRQLDKTLLQGTPSADDRFGMALAAADFNGDQIDDLAVVSSHGLNVIYGVQGQGIAASSPQSLFDLAALGLQVSLGHGYAELTTGDYNCDGYEDLALPSVHETAGNQGGAGAVIVLYGGPTGLTAAARQRLDETVEGIATDPLQGERFGLGIASGNFNGDSFSARPCVDLAIGVNEGTGAIRNGAVHVVFGGPQGLNGVGSQHLTQGGATADGGTIADVSELGDGFGSYLAITRADLDRYDDLIASAYNENFGEGAAHVLRGSASGIVAAGQAFWRQGSDGIPEVPETVVTPPPHELTAGDRFGFNVGGTSNGLVVIGAAWESFPTAAFAGWAAFVRVNDTSLLQTPKQVMAATEQSLTSLLPPGSTLPLREDAFFGATITRARPAFVPRTAPQPRYGGNLVLTSGTLPTPCAPDSTAPVIHAARIEPACIWPPNDKLVAYELGRQIVYSVTDQCDPNPVVRIASVTSNEVIAGDAFFSDENVCLRAQRDDDGSGRIYTVTLEVRDAAGNATHSSVAVTVPKRKISDCGLPPSVFTKACDGVR
jgi:hypothetical protein